MPVSHAETRNIVFLKSAVRSRSLFTEKKGTYEQNNRSNYQTHRRNVREKIGQRDIANHESSSNSQLRRTGSLAVRRCAASAATSGRSSHPSSRSGSEPDRLESS